MVKKIKYFFKTDSATGLVLLVVSAISMVVANSFLASQYEAFFSGSTKFFINDILMAVFFLLVGMEIRSEIEHGSLSTRKKALLPVFVAIGGVIAPAFIYFMFNIGSVNLRGVAIPTATDIAFSLGILALFGSRLPKSLKILLMAIAVIDDLIAVVIIAVFYTEQINLPPLFGAIAVIILLLFLKKFSIIHYLGAVLLWCFIYYAGIHPTIAGVIFGLLIPISSSEKLIHKLQPFVSFCIVPLFAFANAGINFALIPSDVFSNSITIAIFTALFIGKPFGIFFSYLLLAKNKICELPKDIKPIEFFAVCVICGIGFTMSLFITDLAFYIPLQILYAKVGVVFGSLCSAVFGAVLLFILNSQRKKQLENI